MFSLADAFSTILEGIWVTLGVTFAGAILALGVSFAAGLLSLSPSRIVRGANRVFVEVFRGTSLLVQLFWLAFALPFLGFRMDLLLVGIVAVGLNYGAYGAEVVRGAIQAIPKAQYEATVALSMTPSQRMRLVLLPQAAVGMIPPFCNLWIQLLKGTSLVAGILLIDITYQAREYARPFAGDLQAILLTFGVVLAIYFVLAQVITVVMRLLERVAKTSIGEAPPPLFRGRKPTEAVAGV